MRPVRPWRCRPTSSSRSAATTPRIGSRRARLGVLFLARDRLADRSGRLEEVRPGHSRYEDELAHVDLHRLVLGRLTRAPRGRRAATSDGHRRRMDARVRQARRLLLRPGVGPLLEPLELNLDGLSTLRWLGAARGRRRRGRRRRGRSCGWLSRGHATDCSWVTGAHPTSRTASLERRSSASW